MTAYTKYNDLSEVLNHQGTKKKKGITFVKEDGDHFLSYHQLYHDALRILHSIRAMGIKKNSEILFQLEQSDQFIKMFWACILGEFLPVPVQTSGIPELSGKIEKIWNKLNNPCLVSCRSHLKKLNLSALPLRDHRIIFIEDLLKGEMEEKIVPGDQHNNIAFIQFSSGSSGDPKGIILRHRQMLANLNSFLERVRYTSDDNPLSWMPLVHDMGLIGFHIAPLLMGSNHTIMPTGLFIRKPINWLKKASLHQSTILNATTSSINYFLKYFKREKDHSLDLSKVRLVFVGAEPVSAKTCSVFIDKMKGTGLPKNSIFPVYGLAEATLAVTFPDPGEGINTISLDRKKLMNFSRIHIAPPGSQKAPTFTGLGKPIKNLKLRITDPDHNPLPRNTIGFVEIEGPSVTEGYYNEPERTEELINQEGWLKTGDLGFLNDGHLYITGRHKDVIFKNGQNIYSHDLESVIGEMEEIIPGNVVVVGLYNSKLQEDEIIVFIRVRGNDHEQQKILSGKISDHLIHRTGLLISRIIGIRKVPKTSSGKIKRYILREEYKKGVHDSPENILFTNTGTGNPQISGTRDEHHSDLLNRVIHLFREQLADQNIFRDTNFFHMGGDSLQAAALISKIDHRFNRTIDLATFFKHPTPEAVYQLIRKTEIRGRLPLRNKAEQNIKKQKLLPTQKRIYFLSMFRKECIAYNIPFAFKVRGDVNPTDLEHAIEQILLRHDNLRTVFVFKKGEVSAVVQPDGSFSLKKVPMEKESLITEIRHFIQPFNLEHPPLFRAVIFSISDDEQYLVFDFHHLIMDGFSIGIFLKELFEIYNGSEPGDIICQFADYLKWRDIHLSAGESQRQKQFWMKKFHTRGDQKELPADFPRPQIQSFEGSSLNFVLDSAGTSLLAETASTYNCTEFTLFLTAYLLFLSKLTGDRSPVTGIPLLGRPPLAFNKTMGMFVNIVPFSITIEKNISCSDLFAMVHNEIAVSQMNSYYQFTDLLDKRSNMSRNPLFDTILVYHNWNEELTLNGNLELSHYPLISKTSKFELSLNIIPVKDCRYLSLEYSTALFTEDTAGMYRDSYLSILKEVAKNPDQDPYTVIEQPI